MPARNIKSCIAVFLYLAVGSLLRTRIALPALRQGVPQKRAATMSENAPRVPIVTEQLCLRSIARADIPARASRRIAA
jgi:hypothetical protein